MNTKILVFVIYVGAIICLLLYNLHDCTFNEGWLFIGRFKVGSLPRIINKEVLAQFIYQLKVNWKIVCHEKFGNFII